MLFILALLVVIGLAIVSSKKGERIWGESSLERQETQGPQTQSSIQHSQRLPPIIRNPNAGGFPGGTRTAVLPQPAISKENIYEYPRCPKCWAGNREGEPQSVFFVEAGNYFQCERGHQFLRNGKMRN